MLLRRKGRNRAPLHEHFQFETLRASNIRPVVSRKSEFFRSLRAGRRGAAASRFPFFQRQNAHGARPGGRALPNTFLSHTPIKGATATVLRKRIFARTKNEERPREALLFFYWKNSQTIRPVASRKNAAFPLTSGRAARCRRSEKSALGEGWGAWGEGLRERLSFGKAEPSRAGRGVSLPPNNLRIVLTGSNGRDIAACRRRAR